MSVTKHQSWNQVKAKIILRFGTIKAAGAAIDASSEAIRLSTKGKCPHVAKRLKEVLG